jgi:hypothetical protein
VNNVGHSPILQDGCKIAGECRERRSGQTAHFRLIKELMALHPEVSPSTWIPASSASQPGRMRWRSDFL